VKATAPSTIDVMTQASGLTSVGLRGIVNLESLILNPRSRIVESEAVIHTVGMNDSG